MKENLNGKEIKKSFRKLPIWKGKPISDSYGNKPVLEFNGVPVFAELYALREYKENGFDGVWADSYRNRFRTELPEKNEPKISLPEFVNEKLNKINPNGKLSGTWDLILWKNEKLKFVELKRQKKDKIRQTQIDFLERAIRNGIGIENFEIYEWEENK
jgi:hypothetical protein